MGKYLLFFALFLALFLAVPAWAQSDEPAVGEDAAVVSADADVTVSADVQPIAEEPELEGMVVEEPKEVPSGFGLWWKSLKEKVSIGLTINPVKKAEKQLQFAEERMRLAELMAQKAEDQKTQVRIHRMIGQAQEMMEKVEARRDRLVQQNDERARRLLRNIATHQVRREVIMDKIEEKLPGEAVEKWEELRDEVSQSGRRLINAINNENVPTEVREHLQAVKDRIEAHAEEIRQYRERRLKLMEQFKTGDEGAKEQVKEQLQELRQDRVDTLHERRVNYEEKKQERLEKIEENAEAGKPTAVKKLEVINKVKDLKQKIKNNSGAVSPAPVGDAADQPAINQ